MANRYLKLVLTSAVLLCVSLAFSGCKPKEPMFKPDGATRAKLAIRLVKVAEFEDSEALRLPEEQRLYLRDGIDIKNYVDVFVARTPVLTEADIVGTSVEKLVDEGEVQWNVLVFLSPEGGQRFARFSQENIDQSAAIFLEDKLCMTPRIAGPIPGNTIAITQRDYTEESATALAKRLVGK